MSTVKQMLEKKGSDVVCVGPYATVLDASQLMNDHHIGSLVVCEANRLIGIFTERDVLRRVVAEHRSPEKTKIVDVMTQEVACASPHTSLNEIRSVMREKRIRHLPVLDSSNLVIGMISIGDVNRAENDEQAQTIRYLEQYMTCT